MRCWHRHKTACMALDMAGACCTRLRPWPVLVSRYPLPSCSKSLSARHHNLNICPQMHPCHVSAAVACCSFWPNFHTLGGQMTSILCCSMFEAQRPTNDVTKTQWNESVAPTCNTIYIHTPVYWLTQIAPALFPSASTSPTSPQIDCPVLTGTCWGDSFLYCALQGLLSYMRMADKH